MERMRKVLRNMNARMQLGIRPSSLEKKHKTKFLRGAAYELSKATIPRAVAAIREGTLILFVAVRVKI